MILFQNRLAKSEGKSKIRSEIVTFRTKEFTDRLHFPQKKISPRGQF